MTNLPDPDSDGEYGAVHGNGGRFQPGPGSSDLVTQRDRSSQEALTGVDPDAPNWYFTGFQQPSS